MLSLKEKCKRLVLWKDIPGYDGVYKINNKGDVKSIGRKILHCDGKVQVIKEKILKQILTVNGYFAVNLYKDKKCKTIKTHQLVAIAFLNHTPNRYKVSIDHKNFIKSDNNVDNLKIITHRENSSKKQKKSQHTSKYTGLSWDEANKKWAVRIMINGKVKHLGRYTDEEKANQVYQSMIPTVRLKNKNKSFINN